MIREETGLMHIMEGNCVFGKEPLLEPGAVFSYGGVKILSTVPIKIQVQFYGVDQVLFPFISAPFTFPKRTLKLCD